MKTIKITCKGQKYLPIDDLKNFQGGLKAIYDDELEKLKRSILKHGFSFPVFIWKKFILDGHQRIFATKALVDDGYSIGDIPVVEIQARNRKHAAEKLLFLNSHYAKITNDGLFDFLSNNQLDMSELAGDLELPDIDIDDFLKTGGDTGDGDGGGESGLSDVEYQILIDCRSEKHQTELLNKFEKEGLECRPLML